MATLVAATDFSDAAEVALEVAAAWTARTGATLYVVHVLPDEHATVERLELRRARLAARMEALRAGGHAVDGSVRVGAPADEILQAADEVHAALIVLGAVGETSGPPWGVGGVVEAVALHASVPMLAVRASLLPWLRGERPLRALVGVDLSTASAAAARWARALSQVGPTALTLVHTYTRSDAARLADRIALRGEVPGDPSAIQTVLRRDLGIRIGAGETPIVLDPTTRSPARRLAALATEAAADLLVVGAPSRTGLERVVRGSTVHGVLARASTSIALVPSDAAPARPPIQRVLVPIDFTPASESALPYARGLVDDRGTLVLVHVAEVHYDGPSERRARQRELERRLAALVPSESGVAVRVEVVEEAEVAPAIIALAERAGVDAICMGTRGSALGKALVGSVAGSVVARSRRPVLLVPPDRG